MRYEIFIKSILVSWCYIFSTSEMFSCLFRRHSLCSMAPATSSWSATVSAPASVAPSSWTSSRTPRMACYSWPERAMISCPSSWETAPLSTSTTWALARENSRQRRSTMMESGIRSTLFGLHNRVCWRLMDCPVGGPANLKYSIGYLTLPMPGLLLSKAQGCKDFWKPSKDECPCARVSVIFQVFCIILYWPNYTLAA